jgi:hypothetical protein
VQELGLVDEYVPAWQTKQAVKPDELLNDPEGHFTQEGDPGNAL